MFNSCNGIPSSAASRLFLELGRFREVTVHWHTNRSNKMRITIVGKSLRKLCRRIVSSPGKAWKGRVGKYGTAWTRIKRGVERQEKVKKCLTRVMHNGERRNPLAGIPRNKYTPFVLVRWFSLVDENGRRGKGRYHASLRVAGVLQRQVETTNGNLDEYSRCCRHRFRSRCRLAVFKTVETKTMFSRDIIHYLKRLAVAHLKVTVAQAS